MLIMPQYKRKKDKQLRKNKWQKSWQFAKTQESKQCGVSRVE
jgi:hypothetical protein